MAQAPDYTPITSFADDESNQASGRAPVRTQKLDDEFANIEASINSVNENLQKLQRDDGKLKDLLVEPYALSEQVRALLASKGVVRGIWQPSTDYNIGDVVQNSVIAYVCLVSHTSGSIFNAGLWIAISGDGSSLLNAQAAQASATSAANSASSASGSASSALSSATSASISANNANTSSVNSANSATQSQIASTTATNAAVVASNSANSAVAAAAEAQSYVDSAKDLPFATTTGTSSAFVADYGVGVTSIEDGAVFTAKFHTPCADNATFQVLGLFPVLDIKVRRSDGTIAPILNGDISGYAICQVIENGTSLLVEPSVEKATVTYLSTATTLTVETALDINLVLTATATHTLPLLSTFIEGGSFNVTANATATIQRQGSDVISLNGADVNSVTLKAGDNVDFVKSAGKWLISGLGDVIKLSTPIVTTSGTAHEYTGIDANVKRISLMVSGVSTSGTSIPILQLGDSGGYETTGYNGTVSINTTGVASANHGVGVQFSSSANAAANVWHGMLTISLLNSATNTWAITGTLSLSNSALTSNISCTKALSEPLDRIRLNTVNGTDTFDAGSININTEL